MHLPPKNGQLTAAEANLALIYFICKIFALDSAVVYTPNAQLASPIKMPTSFFR